ncbi:MAG: cupin domain-containing protein [Candidatus Thermoplasmatota archaeon]
MEQKVILLKKGEEQSKTHKPGRLYRLMVKSNNMEAIIAELDPQAESRWFQHTGEEFHLVLEGEMEYMVGDHTYKLTKGDLLYHDSSLKHKARNNGREKVVYITVGVPPTFMWSML